MAQIQDLRMNIIGIQGGYNYVLALPHRFFILGGLIPGVGLSYGNAEAIDQYDVEKRLMSKLNIRSVIGYIGNHLYTGLTYGADIFFLDINGGNRFNYNIGKLKLVIGYRFNKGIEFIDEALE